MFFVYDFFEFNTVFFVGLDETIIPITRASGSTEELEEERRLVYVAVTRAMKKLYLTRAKSRFLYGSRAVTIESRFVTEIKDSLFIPNSDYVRNAYNNFGGSYESKMERSGYKIRDEYGYYPDEDLPSRSTGNSNFASA